MVELLQLGLCVKYFPESSFYVVISFVAVIIIGYLLGSLNFGVIISTAFYHDDIRKHGSGSAGMTNMLRTYGKIPAALTFLGDGLKTVAAVFIGALFLGHHYTYAGSYIGGIACMIGHAYPVYYKFKGGKGVTAAFFMVLCTNPLVALICLIIFIIIVAGTKYISLGSIMSILIYPLILNRLTGVGLHNLIAILAALFVVYLHRANIQRLMSGTENKLNLKSKKNKKSEKSEKKKKSNGEEST